MGVQPVIGIHNLIRVGGGYKYLSKKRIGIECYRGKHLV
jgi:hypothetical protein